MPAVRQKLHLSPCSDFRDQLFIPWVNLTVTGNGDAVSGLLAEKRHHRRCREPGNFAARVLVGRRPGSWIAEWMDRRVVRELSLLLVTLPPPNFAPPLIADVVRSLPAALAVKPHAYSSRSRLVAAYSPHRGRKRRLSSMACCQSAVSIWSGHRRSSS